MAFGHHFKPFGAVPGPVDALMRLFLRSVFQNLGYLTRPDSFALAAGMVRGTMARLSNGIS